MQPALFGLGPISFDAALPRLTRHELDGEAWVDYCPEWLGGHDALFDHLVETTQWHHHRRPMYERMVDVPRLTAGLPDDGPGHPILDEIAAALSVRYGLAFNRIGLGLYRDGNDSVAWHGDQVARDMTEAIIATVSVGEPRRVLLRPNGGGPSVRYELGRGDLIVMGGSCQRTWQHCVPKAARAGPRMAIMFRSWLPSVDDPLTSALGRDEAAEPEVGHVSWSYRDVRSLELGR